MQNVSEEILECNFINGLTPNIRAEVELLNPVGLEKIMDVAQKVEGRNMMMQQSPSTFRLARLKSPIVVFNSKTAHCNK